MTETMPCLAVPVIGRDVNLYDNAVASLIQALETPDGRQSAAVCGTTSDGVRALVTFHSLSGPKEEWYLDISRLRGIYWSFVASIRLTPEEARTWVEKLKELRLKAEKAAVKRKLSSDPIDWDVEERSLRRWMREHLDLNIDHYKEVADDPQKELVEEALMYSNTEFDKTRVNDHAHEIILEFLYPDDDEDEGDDDA